MIGFFVSSDGNTRTIDAGDDIEIAPALAELEDHPGKRFQLVAVHGVLLNDHIKTLAFYEEVQLNLWERAIRRTFSEAEAVTITEAVEAIGDHGAEIMRAISKLESEILGETATETQTAHEHDGCDGKSTAATSQTGTGEVQNAAL